MGWYDNKTKHDPNSAINVLNKYYTRIKREKAELEKKKEIAK